jgi:hypothetical protein
MGLYAPYYEIINSLNSNLLKHFESVFYNKGNSKTEIYGSADVSGYTLIYLIPPQLSGLFFDILPTSIVTGRNTIFAATEFSPPECTLNIDQVASSSNVRIPYAVGKTSGGQMSISYVENMRLDNYAFHNNWVNYIEQVMLGYLDPSDDVINSGELDYATSAFVMRYKPDMKSMVYLGKAIGIFPINLPNKEIIGSRQNPTLTTFSINYACTDYREISLIGDGMMTPSSFAANGWIISDFVESVKLMFGDVGLEDIGSLILSNLGNPYVAAATAQMRSF